MPYQPNKRQWLAIIIVIAIGLVLAWRILSLNKSPLTTEAHAMQAQPTQATEAGIDDHHHDAQAPEIAKGPHGGKLFTQDGYGVEITIFEQNVAPEFRIYTYQNEKLLDPALSAIRVTLKRLGQDPQSFSFSQEKDYLKSDASVKEPHSFTAEINAEYQHKSYRFDYAQTEARVHLTDAQVSHNNIEVLAAGPATIKATLQLQGEIKRNADKTVQIVPRVGGIVEQVSANAGDNVRKGQILATIASESVAALRSDLLAAQKIAALARKTYSREKQLWEAQISAEQDYLQAQHDLQEAEINTARVQAKLDLIGAGSTGQGHYAIRSPIDGVITKKQISQGQVVSGADDIFEVADLSTVWVEIPVYSKDINIVKPGQQVTVQATAFEAQATGTITYVSALVGEQSRTATARVVLNNQAHTWLPGLPVNVLLVADKVDVPIAVSTEGIQTLGDWHVVFGRYGSYFEARPLVLGRRDERYVEVLEGLRAGELYAAGNSFLIKADIGKAGASHDH